MNEPTQRDWEIAAKICREIAELPDRTGCEHMTPDDMLVTADELHPIIAAAAADARRQAIEECARWHDDQGTACRHIAETIQTEWMGPEIPAEDRRANAKDRLDHLRLAGHHDRCAKAIRALLLAAPGRRDGG